MPPDPGCMTGVQLGKGGVGGGGGGGGGGGWAGRPTRHKAGCSTTSSRALDPFLVLVVRIRAI